MTIQRMCELAGVSRASFYRDWEQKSPGEAEVASRDAVQRTALAHRDHGYRRITPLIQRAGFVVGEEFVFLAVVLDAFSRKAIGWELGRTLETKLALAAASQIFMCNCRSAVWIEGSWIFSQ